MNIRGLPCCKKSLRGLFYKGTISLADKTQPVDYTRRDDLQVASRQFLDWYKSCRVPNPTKERGK